MFFIVNNSEKCLGGGVLARFYRPGSGSFELLFCPGGEFAHQKKLPGGMVRLGFQAFFERANPGHPDLYIMSQSIPTGYIPPDNPGGKLF